MNSQCELPQFTVLENIGIALLSSMRFKSDAKAPQPRASALMSGMNATAEELAHAKRANSPWSNLAAASTALEPSYSKLASFSANGCFLAPPVTLAGFTSGAPPSGFCSSLVPLDRSIHDLLGLFVG